MSRRVIGILASLLLALLGTVALVAYVSTAEDRALAGQELVEVYVVTEAVPSGTPGEELQDLVTVEEVPAKVRALGAVESLNGLSGLVTAIDLLPGEQLVESRFIGRSEAADRQVGIEIPEDMVELTLELESQRAVGGLVEPGQTVAVFASFQRTQVSGETTVPVEGEQIPIPSSAASDATAPSETDLLLHKVLVTAVQEPPAQSGIGSDDNGDRLTTAPEDTVFVTMALTPFDAERLVFTAENGTVWLAIERDTVPESADQSQTRESVYQEQVAVR